MKILQVSHGLPPTECAGVELYTLHLSRALSCLGHKISILCREGDPGREEFSSFEEEMDGVRVTRVVNNLKGISDIRDFYENHSFDEIFLNVLKRERPDVIHFQHLYGLSGNLVRIAKEEGYPVVFTLHDFYVLCHRIHLLKGENQLCSGPVYGLECIFCLDIQPGPHDRRTRFFLNQKDLLPFPVIKWTKRFFIPPKYLNCEGYEVFHRYRYMYEIFKSCDLMLAPSRFVRTLFLKYYPSMKYKVRTLSLGIPPFRSQDGRPHRTDGKMRFCYFGNILPIKGLHVLIDAFKRLPPGRAVLTIYGGRTSWNGAYHDALKQQASGASIEFRGPFQGENLAEALKDQDVAVLPSICYESFSFVIREANLMGLPVIASRIGAIPEAIEDGQNGFLFETGSPEALKRCMLRFIDDPRLIQEMGSRMPKVKFMAEHARDLVELYKMIINTSGLKGKD